LRQDLEDAVKMRHAGAETIDKLRKHELSIQQGIEIGIDLFRELVKKLGLDAGEGLGGLTALLGQMWIRLPPLTEFCGPLPLRDTHLVQKILQQFRLPLFNRQELPQ
jgi:hypothetical protein